ncbi:hypothetical protein EST38_g14068 [Candolleomyces aberdarensis]|uniref:Nephrocystin 3-like N-terminal domain-containing protein n=1 Tax=Candolleomyces aberdarensis TaxID=2316362 RepID=A0A4Q2CY86_9AGAR|nr:hypothetical protein EST38_g14068 [Candolleomyces aberdarensis]
MSHLLFSSGWELLAKQIAPNALHNSSARYDAPKCDEDTRVEVIGEIRDCIEDLESPHYLLCMTGAAGAGKSALQQTIAEICSTNNTLGSAFFFSAGDSTRNTVQKVVPTIAYQLGCHNVDLKGRIKAAVEDEPLIFSKTLEVQMNALIAEPFEHATGTGIDLRGFPHVILIDGLDECAEENRQEELLIAIKKCLLIDSLPFRVFITSRPEWAIRTALEPGGHLHAGAYHIQLSDQYDASGDMRRYLQRRFCAIGTRIGDPQWYREDNVEALVRNGSGQFVYVATVYKFISERRGSPVERLNIVLTWALHRSQVVRPFEALDYLYTNILHAAKNAYEAVDTHSGRDFLLLFRCYVANTPTSNFFGPDEDSFRFFEANFTRLLGLETRSLVVLVSDLRSLVTLDKEKERDDSYSLQFYHRSFAEFLEEEMRAKELFVSLPQVYVHIIRCFFRFIVECEVDFDSRGSSLAI